MTSTDLNFFKSYLLSQKAAILNKAAEFKCEQRDRTDKPIEEAELASTDVSLNVSIHLHERDRSSLLQIERALGKIADGTYGQCESCGATIDARRLKARPFTVLCIDCMEDLEDQGSRLH